MNIDEMQNKINKGNIDGNYIFYGIEEQLMKENISQMKKTVLDKNFIDLNYIQFDGNSSSLEEVINVCETAPFLSDKKIVVVYRSSFLKGGDSNEKEGNNKFNVLYKYLENPAPYTILIVYYVFEDEREKVSSKIKKLEKKAYCIKFDKLKGMYLEKKVKKIFDDNKKDIGKVELKFFCENVDPDMNIIFNEVEKLCSFTDEREITKNDILLMLPQKSDNDIFDLVDSLAQKKPEKALDILNELIFKGEKIPMILFMIERQFRLLFNIKAGIEDGKKKENLISELKLNPYICDKMIMQSRKFTVKQLKNALDKCLSTEKIIKSSSVNLKIQMELLIINVIL
ncbi:MAG: DNA polymerase III subunit delta [Bacillota bacterium]|nr:DNA polymerase III subunit delta [Bacillota bacterium]